MKITHSFEIGNVPAENGLYVVEVYFGWKILEWFDGEWWHCERVGRWTASEPLQWLGPLPPRAGPKTGQKGAETPKPEYDL